MEYLYASASALLLDCSAQERYHIPSLALMEDAALSAYLRVKDEILSTPNVIFVAGCGNNGGDALAMARFAFLDGKRDLSIYLAEGRESEERRVQREILSSFPLARKETIEGGLIIDGLFGVGLKGALRPEALSLVEKINAHSDEVRVISIDVPSGIGDDVPFGPAVYADITITMGVGKRSLYLPQNRQYAGRILSSFPLFPLPSPGDALIARAQDYQHRQFKAAAYKKTRGHLAIVGGSGRFTGAVILSAKAAFSAGAGLVSIFTSPSLIPIIASCVPSAMVSSYDEEFELSSFDAVLAGNGLGSSHDFLVSKCLKEAKCLVLDADGVRAFARLKKADPSLKARNVVMTPHLGEAQALLDDQVPSTPQQYLSAFASMAKDIGATLVIKGAVVWIISEEESIVVDGCNPSLGVAGSGDVLAGVIAAFCMQEHSRPCVDAVLLHQAAGAEAHEKEGYYPADALFPFIGKGL